MSKRHKLVLVADTTELFTNLAKLSSYAPVAVGQAIVATLVSGKISASSRLTFTLCGIEVAELSEVSE